MGNRSSGEKVRRQSEEDYREKNGSFKGSRDFVKSQSMGELGRASKRKKNSIPSNTIERPRASGSLRNGSVAAVSRQKSIRRDIAHPITGGGREIIIGCFENPHSEFGNKTCQRIFEKRQDFQQYVFTLGKERAFQMTVKLKELIEEVVSRIDDVDYIATACRSYGEDHVELKTYGFKPDFWVALADAITVEGVILDMASHQPADTVAAWSQLVTMMFSSVRDGYYTALRAHRMSSRRGQGMRRQVTNDSASSGGDGGNLSPTGMLNGHHSSSVRSVSMYGMENGGPKPMPIFE